MAVEDLFFGQNARTAFAVGQARGAMLLAGGQAGMPCYSYTPQAIKQAVCGNGRADKDQVQRMVGALLALAEPPEPDHAADALAVAICHANGAPRAARGARMIASVGDVTVRRPDHVVIECAGVGYRLGGLGRDAEGCARAWGGRRCSTPTWSCATTACTSTASRPRRSASCSCC